MLRATLIQTLLAMARDVFWGPWDGNSYLKNNFINYRELLRGLVHGMFDDGFSRDVYGHIWTYLNNYRMTWAGVVPRGNMTEVRSVLAALPACK